MRREADEHRRCELLLALGDAQARGGDLPTAKETFVRAAAVARSLQASGNSREPRSATAAGGRSSAPEGTGD